MHALWLLANTRQEWPNLLGGEAHDRRKQANQHLSNAPDRRLPGTARERSARIGVQTVFQHVDIEVTEFGCAKGNDALIDAMECELLVPAQSITHQVCRDE